MFLSETGGQCGPDVKSMRIKELLDKCVFIVSCVH